MPRALLRFFFVSVLLLPALVPKDTCAQLYGSLYSNLYHSSNIFGSDTASSGDEIWENSLTLGYQVPLSKRASFLASASYSPQLYFANSARSFSSIYLAGEFRMRIGKIEDLPGAAAAVDPPMTDGGGRAAIERAVFGLYDAVSSLDSVVPKRTGSRAEKDSLSEILFTVADLLDSTDFGTSVQAIVLDELRDVLPRVRVYSRSAAAKLEAASTLIASTETASTFDALLGSFDGLAGEDPSAELDISDASEESDLGLGAPDLGVSGLGSSAMPQVVPPNLRVPLTSKLTYLSGESLTLREDAWAPTRTTFSSLLRTPVYFSDRRDRPDYEALDYSSVGAGATFSGYPLDRLGLSASLNVSRTRYVNDSVYSSNQITLLSEARVGVGNSTTFLLEAGSGSKTYITPLTLSADPRNPRDKASALPSSFSQYTFGGGIVQDITDGISAGLIGTFTRSPDLRAYLVDLTALRNRYTSGISDDEYSYDMSRATLLLLFRAPYNIDVGLTLRREHRRFGDLILKQKGKPINNVAGASRFEDETRLGVAPSRYFFFDTPLLGVFETLQLRGELGYESVASSLQDYSYSALNASLSLALDF